MSKAIHKQTPAHQEGQRTLDNIADNLPGMVYRCRNNRNWTMEYVSNGSEALTGYTPNELILDKALPYASLILDGDRDRVWQTVQTAIQDNRQYKINYRIKTKQGNQKWLWEQGCVARTAEDDTAILEGIIIDNTEQKQLEASLRDNQNRFRNLVDGSIEGICVHQDWRPLFANQTLADILGYDSAAEILALRSIGEIIAPHDRNRLLDYKRAREAGGAAPKHYEFEALRRDGSSAILETVAISVDWGGQAAILSTIIDVTERKRAVREAEQLRKQLAHFDRLSTLGEMATGIAHEINQPLTAIISRCGAAKRRIDRDKPDQDKLRSTLEIIEQQAQRTGEIIQRIRELAKQEHDFREIIDINRLLQQCLEFAEMDGRTHEISTKVDIISHLPPISGDPVQIQQVLLNLIHNAAEAMEQMPVKDWALTVSAKRHDESAIQLAVTDCGTGINQETEAKLFRSFFTTKKSGMGMGLSISRSIIAAHGGQLWFTRNPERGVTFRFTLPIAMGEEHG